MRKAFSIFFLCLFLLYQVGYLGYYWYSARQIDNKWMSDVEITPDMQHFSIPIALPYWTSQSEYRVTTGKIVINGTLYRKVMQKYAMDAIHLIVAKDRDTEKLNHSIADWVRAMSNGESNNKNGADLLKSVIKEYMPESNNIWSASRISFLLHPNFGMRALVRVKSLYREVTTPPPQT